MKAIDIAKELNVSPSSVSRVLNNKSGVSEETRDYIQKFLIKKKIIKKYKKIAMIVPDLGNPYFAEIIKEVFHYIFDKDYELVIYDTDEDVEKEAEIINKIIDEGFAGVILSVADGNASLINAERLKKSQVPFILFDRDLELNSNGVFLDDFQGGIMSAELLLEKNCTKIGIIHGNMSLKSISGRYNGIAYALSQRNLSLDSNLVFEGDMKVKTGYDIVERIHQENIEIDGVIILNNFMSIGALNYLTQSKSKLKLVGFDIPDYIQPLYSNYSCVKSPKNKMGKAISELILKKLESQELSEKVILNPIAK